VEVVSQTFHLNIKCNFVYTVTDKSKKCPKASPLNTLKSVLERDLVVYHFYCVSVPALLDRQVGY